MKKILICLITLCPFLATTYSQTISKDMMYFVIDQYVDENFDTSIAQDVYINVIGREKLNGHHTLGKTKIILFDPTKERQYFRKMTRSNGLFYTLRINILSNDTINFNFSKCQVTRENKHYCIWVESAGDLGYIPFARFIYAKDEKQWIFISFEELMKNAVSNLHIKKY